MILPMRQVIDNKDNLDVWIVYSTDQRHTNWTSLQQSLWTISINLSVPCHNYYDITH